MVSKETRIRKSILELQTLYEAGEKKPLEDLMRAFRGIQSLDPSDKRSFFTLGGYHGLPYKEGKIDRAYWVGYCAHRNVLFPTWHRVYLYKVEEALRSIPGCEDVTLPYWDQTDEYSLKNGLPWPLTKEKFTLDGEEISNPLRSYILPVDLVDPYNGKKGEISYFKPKGYETKRYPFAGAVRNEREKTRSRKHNEDRENKDNTNLLNDNITDWLGDVVYKEYQRCLEAPNYTVFSNVTSAAKFNSESKQKGEPSYVSLESPHNHIHLAVGGFRSPVFKIFRKKFIEDSSGDMGENETSAFDPIFYFHHCNVDRIFWIWQKKHGFQDKLEIIPFHHGTSTNDGQGPSPGWDSEQSLGMASPLYPFKRIENGKEYDFTSSDCVNIETQLGYNYSEGSFDIKEKAPYEKVTKSLMPEKVTKFCVSNLRKDQVKGSFIVEAYLPVGPDDVRFLGAVSVLSRWELEACANCQKYLNLRFFFDLPNIPGLENPRPYAKIISRGSTRTINYLGNTEEEDEDPVEEAEAYLVYQLY